MFVTQATYQEERERRIAAEARADELQKSLASAQLLTAELLERFMPKPTAHITGSSPEKPLTSKDVLRMPAIGRRGILARQRHADELRVSEEENGHAKPLDESERAAIDAALAI